MSTVIRNGTIVTADLTYKADVLIEHGRIAAIGQGLTGDSTLDATGCLVMPGGIDPHTHLEMPFMGTYSADDFDSGTRAALAGETAWLVGGAVRDRLLGRETDDVDLAIAGDPKRSARTIARAAGGAAFELSGAFGAWRVVGPGHAWHVDLLRVRDDILADGCVPVDGPGDYTISGPDGSVTVHLLDV